MRSLIRLASVGALAATAVVAFGAPAFADQPGRGRDGRDDDSARSAHVVFVQTDDPVGNHVVAYDRSDDGTLALAGSYATGGVGGVLAGSVVDHLASQASLTYDAGHDLLFAVNAGSDTVSVFAVRGDRLVLRQVVPSYGDFPVSIAVHDNLVYVLNGLGGGSVQGYGVLFDRLLPIPGSTRALGLDPSATPQFVQTPGQVAFSPDGSQLIVTTKANGSAVDVFRVNRFGTLSASPVVNVVPGAVPFAVTFDPSGDLVVSEAGTNAVATFALHRDGTIVLRHSVATGQAATCWIVADRSQLYASNAGSGSVSRVRSGPGGALTLVDTTSTDPGSVDAAVTPNGRYLYVQTGAGGIVDEFRVNLDGSLSQIGTVTVAGAIGGEGIVAL
jgi:6-phosphogluconolactonase (cycloisomerase 2 family)